jgi:hypothetical protein
MSNTTIRLSTSSFLNDLEKIKDLGYTFTIKWHNKHGVEPAKNCYSVTIGKDDPKGRKLKIYGEELDVTVKKAVYLFLEGFYKKRYYAAYHQPRKGTPH